METREQIRIIGGALLRIAITLIGITAYVFAFQLIWYLTFHNVESIRALDAGEVVGGHLLLLIVLLIIKIFKETLK